jgi:osmoprotectant transport system substrate-binding protein
VSPTLTRRRLFAAGMAVLAVASGCGAPTSDAATPPPEEITGGTIGKDIDLSGTEFAVGSKEFTEQKILGKIMSYSLQAAGATVIDRTGLSGSNIARTALENGDIDMYWEYAGTGWSLFLKNEKPVAGARKQFDAVAREDETRNQIAWLGPAKFGNQYAVARRSDATGSLGELDSLSQLRDYFQQYPEEATFCGAAEFLDREFSGFQNAYDIRFPTSQVYQNDFALNFVNAAKGSPCNFAEVFTTDARIKSLDLKVLRDDRNYFFTQLAGLTVRSETRQKYPHLSELARRLGSALTEDTVIELNSMVDLEGATADKAALHFLRTRGFIANPSG